MGLDKMKPLIDAYGKVTVSLGGVCTLACRHCYTTAGSFTKPPSVSIAEVTRQLDALVEAGRDLKTICVSGDTDPFLDDEQ